jgi:hypothetical protein
MKNPAAVALGRKGGLARSPAKAAANRAKGESLRRFWAEVKAGNRPDPRRK